MGFESGETLANRVHDVLRGGRRRRQLIELHIECSRPDHITGTGEYEHLHSPGPLVHLQEVTIVFSVGGDASPPKGC